MRLTLRHWGFAVLLAAACLLTWWISSQHFYGAVNADSAILGSMWAVIATIFVLRESHSKSLSAGLVRVVTTVCSAILCLLYFLAFSFSPIGLALLIAVGYLVANALDRPDDAVPTGITITVVMVVGALNPEKAWLEPLLRLADTLIGSAVAIAAALIAGLLRLEAPEAAKG